MAIVGPNLNQTGRNFKTFVQVLGGGFASEDLSQRIWRKMDSTGFGTGASNLLIDGATTPTTFLYKANPTVLGVVPNQSIIETHVSEVRLVLHAKKIVEDGSSFAGLSALTNGIELEFVTQGATFLLENWKTMADFRNSWTVLISDVDRSGKYDVMTAIFEFAGLTKLDGGAATVDEIRLRIQDNLINPNFTRFQATVGALEVLFPI